MPEVKESPKITRTITRRAEVKLTIPQIESILKDHLGLSEAKLYYGYGGESQLPIRELTHITLIKEDRQIDNES